MLSDRFWSLKVGLAAGLFALLCWKSQKDFSAILPDAEGATLQAGGLLGKPVYLWDQKVLSADDDGFTVNLKTGPFHVSSPLRPRPGDYVTLTGRITGPRRLEAVKARVLEGYLWKRAANYVLSAATIVVFLWLARRRFRWNLSQGLFRSRS